MNYWPDTKIIKSQGNAFNWQNAPSFMTKDKEVKASITAKNNMAGAGTDPRRAFTIYSKAKAKS